MDDEQSKMKHFLPVFVLLMAAGCGTTYRVSDPVSRRVSDIVEGTKRVSAIVMRSRLNGIAQEEEGSASGFERRLEELGAKIEVGSKPPERIAMIPIPDSLECFRVVYLARSRVVVLRVEVVPAPPTFA